MRICVSVYVRELVMRVQCVDKCEDKGRKRRV